MVRHSSAERKFGCGVSNPRIEAARGDVVRPAAER
jgi:hypothetical protein